MTSTTLTGLCQFLRSSPTAFHAVEAARTHLEAAGAHALPESQPWQLQPGKTYYVTRNQSSLIAFRVGQDLADHNFHIVASHSDSPAFKLKERPLLPVRGRYVQLNTEGYGGMLCATWFDRPLSLAGRVLVQEEGKLVSRLVNLDRDLLIIPSVAIHMNREANRGMAYNQQIDLLPLLGDGTTTEEEFFALIGAELGVSPADICGSDLFLYPRTAPTVWGLHGEYLSAPHLDDLQCAYAALQAFLQGSHPQTTAVYALFDNEEVGSQTKQGASSTFLRDVLQRIDLSLGRSQEAHLQAIAHSMMLSADNAHAVHPNHPEKTDPENCVFLNAGVVIKSHAGQKYTSDGVSVALCKALCHHAGAPCQFFSNRSDMAGGSTLGNLSTAQVSLICADIGLPQLAMHSAYETAGVQDTESMVAMLTDFYAAHLVEAPTGTFQLRY
jgi:aspartyl aminopeptidase